MVPPEVARFFESLPDRPNLPLSIVEHLPTLHTVYNYIPQCGLQATSTLPKFMQICVVCTLQLVKKWKRISFRLRQILCDISQGSHDEALCKENCEQNGKLFNHTYHCEYSLENNEIPSGSNRIKDLIHKISLELDVSDTSSPHQSQWNRSNVEDQELAKFDLKVAQFKAMEIEVQEGRRAVEDLKQLKIELEEM